MLVSVLQYRLLPQDPGVYLFLDANNNVLYVGKSKCIRKRVSSYFTHKELGEKTALLVFQITKIKIIRVESEFESLLLEANLIKKYLPKYNIKLTDGKAYPLIRITIKDKYPKVLIARREDDKNSLYFGPYPNSGSLRLVLKTIRRIFPYQSVLNHSKKPCLYNHLGLCPCPEVFKDKDYKKTIRHIMQFLQGNTKKVLKELEKERGKKSLAENFEKALEIQGKIDAIKLIISPTYKPFEYEQNPNLRYDLRVDELKNLKEVLVNSGLVINDVSKIECFDISNTYGTNTVASMVVFINGEKDKNLYRRFKIKLENIGKPDDFLAIKEVIERRFKHSGWKFPDLIIIDGGKGQISSVKEVLNNLNLKIPIIGIAKKEELIFTENFKKITLPHNSKALLLVMRIRDEAHRFAISYHRGLRKKSLFS